jgi:signal transduction histidine kinase
VEQARILIVSDDREFLNSIVQSWQRMGCAPDFAVCGVEAAAGSACSGVVLTDEAAALPSLAEVAALAILVSGEADAETHAGSHVVRILRAEGWADIAAALAQETFRRLILEAQMTELREQMRELERFAAVGRFIVEARHELGNALTGVLGHSELLLLDEGLELRGKARSQLETIRAMSLRMHETFHRLAALEIELRVAEQQRDRSPAL